MRRFALMFLGLLLVGLPAVAASPALAGPTDWAVNGVPLAAGQEVSAKFASVTPVQLIVPDQHIEATCTSWKAKGTLVGGETGTGELARPKFAKCVETNPEEAVKVKIRLETVAVRTDLVHPAGTPSTTELVLKGIFFKKGGKELEISGVVDSFGPKPEEGNLLDFPQPGLEATTLTVGGSPATLVLKAVMTLPKHAMLSQVET